MTRRLTLSLLASLCLAAGLPVHAEDAELQLSVNRDQLYLGESVLLQVKVSGTQQGEPDLTAITNCQARFLGSQASSYSSISIVNGQIHREGFTGRIYTYELTPATPGVFNAGPVSVRIDGREVREEGRRIVVTGTEQQDLVMVEVLASRDSVLVDEPFDITLAVMLRRMPPPLSDIDPLDASAPPQVTAPFLDGQGLDGLRQPDIQQALRGLLAAQDRPGFAINNYTIRNDPFAGNPFSFNFDAFMKERPAKFMFERHAVQRNGNSYLAYTLKLSYTPQVEGNFTFGPAIFKGLVLLGADNRGSAINRRVFAVGPACTVRVVPPPEAGRPYFYIGALGTNMTATASLDTQTCKVGDPLTLTLSISGAVRMDGIVPPQLGLQSNLLTNFRVYDDTVETRKTGGKREYLYKVRPTRAGTFDFPPIRLAFYDTDNRSYRTVTTEPVPVKAQASAELTQDQIIADTNRFQGLPMQREEQTPVATAMRDDDCGADAIPLTGDPRLLLAAAFIPVLFALTAALRRARKWWSHTRPLRVQRRAGRHACAALRRAHRRHLANPAAARRQAYDAIRNYLAERFGVPAGGLTPADARRLLTSAGAEPEVVQKFCEAIGVLFDSAYEAQAGAASTAVPYQALIELVYRIEDSSCAARSARRFPRASTVICLSLLCLASSKCCAEDEAERRFMWGQANSLLAAAKTPGDFRRAAGAYQSLVDAGAHNGSLFYNLGVALLNAELYDDAVNAFVRAERYDGHRRDISLDLQIARAKKAKVKQMPEPWQRIILFWHYRLATPLRSAISAIAFSVFWIALILRFLGLQRVARPLIAVSLAAFVLFGTSVLASILQESAAPRPTFAIPAAVASPAK